MTSLAYSVHTYVLYFKIHDIFGEFTNEKKYILFNPENYFDFPTCAERAPVHVMDTTAKKKCS